MNHSRCILLVTISIALICRTARAQFTDIASNTGKSYGITGWLSFGEQKTTDSAVSGYGINIKYGLTPLQYLRRIREKRVLACKCDKADSITVWDSVYVAHVSFGVGYLGYSGLSIPTSNLASNLKVNAPYAGVWLTFPVLDWFADDDFWKPALVIGGTSALISASDILGTYTGAAIDTAKNFPVKFTIPSTVTYEINAGVSLFGHLFVEYAYHGFMVKNILYSPLDDIPTKRALQEKLPANVDLSFESVKFGFSASF